MMNEQSALHDNQVQGETGKTIPAQLAAGNNLRQDEAGRDARKNAETNTAQHIRMMESVLFAAAEPLDEKSIGARLPPDADIPALLKELVRQYESRGVNLVRLAGKWMFRTAPDMAPLMEREKIVRRRLSRAAMETLAIIAYHQPVTRADIEEIRGVSVSPGTMDVLLEIGWVRIRGRRRTPGRPVVYGTTDSFLIHFDVEDLTCLPGMDELKASGLLDSRLPDSFQMPIPGETDNQDIDPYEEGEDGTFPGNIGE